MRLDMNDLKGAVKSVGTSTSSTTNTRSTSTSSSGVASLSNSEASGGLKEALTQGVGKAVGSFRCQWFFWQ
jgi:hypothetical protein